jgi:hypothetical protein
MHLEELADNAGPVGDDDLVLDPPEQEPSGSMQVDMRDFDWRADTPPPKHDKSPSPTRQDPEDYWGSQHTPDPDSSEEDG